MKTLFNEYGVLDQKSETEMLLRRFYREWEQHCAKLIKEGVPISEIRAVDSIAMSAIAQGTAESILRRAAEMHSVKNRTSHHKLEDRLDDGFVVNPKQ